MPSLRLVVSNPVPGHRRSGDQPFRAALQCGFPGSFAGLWRSGWFFVIEGLVPLLVAAAQAGRGSGLGTAQRL